MTIETGKYYYVEYPQLNLGGVIIKPESDSFSSSYGVMLLDHQPFWRNSWSCRQNLRIATVQEEKYLKACIKAGKKLPKNLYLNNIEIY